MSELVRVYVAEIREGDAFLRDGKGWRAVEDAETFANGEVSVRVQHEPDGGYSDRIWSDATVSLEVERQS